MQDHIQETVWIANRLQKHGLLRNDKCVLCTADEEDVHHLLTGCVIVNIIWGNILNWGTYTGHGLVPAEMVDSYKSHFA
jgi:hypothetical protein